MPEPETCAFEAAAKILDAAGFIDLSGDALTESIKKRLFGIGVNSDDRAHEMLSLTQIVDTEVFWKVFHHCWSSCDDTWALNGALVHFLSFHHAEEPARYYMDREQRKFYNSLPDVVTVFRGCSKERIRGVSWTTEVAVAEEFARGHRGMSPLDHVVAQAQIPKSEIFTVLINREESEIVLNPSELLQIKMLGFARPML